MEYKIIGEREKREILKRIGLQFGIKDLYLPHLFISTGRKKVWLFSTQIGENDLSKFKVEGIGNYFCSIEEDGIRLSIEGSQIIGNMATKNVLEISQKMAEQWLRGIDIDISGGKGDYVIIKYDGNFLGCGKHAEKKVLNSVPKVRRIVSLKETKLLNSNNIDI